MHKGLWSIIFSSKSSEACKQEQKPFLVSCFGGNPREKILENDKTLLSWTIPSSGPSVCCCCLSCNTDSTSLLAENEYWQPFHQLWCFKVVSLCLWGSQGSVWGRGWIERSFLKEHNLLLTGHDSLSLWTSGHHLDISLPLLFLLLLALVQAGHLTSEHKSSCPGFEMRLQ